MIQEKDFLQELAAFGFTARIKRISDALMYDAKKVYEFADLEIEPNWHLIFLLLQKEGQLSVTEISRKLGFSHPAIIKITKKMKLKEYLESATDSNDSRKQLLSLSEKSKNILPAFEEKWKKIEEVMEEFVDGEFLARLAEIEQKLDDKSLFERCKQKLK